MAPQYTPPPVAWVYAYGYTFRHRRGTGEMTVQRGDFQGSHVNANIIARVPADDWHDIAEVRERGEKWLEDNHIATVVRRTHA